MAGGHGLRHVEPLPLSLAARGRTERDNALAPLRLLSLDPPDDSAPGSPQLRRQTSWLRQRPLGCVVLFPASRGCYHRGRKSRLLRSQSPMLLPGWHSERVFSGKRQEGSSCTSLPGAPLVAVSMDRCLSRVSNRRGIDSNPGCCDPKTPRNERLVCLVPPRRVSVAPQRPACGCARHVRVAC